MLIDIGTSVGLAADLLWARRGYLSAWPLRARTVSVTTTTVLSGGQRL